MLPSAHPRGSAASLALTSQPGEWSLWSFEEGPYAGFDRSLCRWLKMTPPRLMGLRTPWNGSVCLRQPGDFLSDSLAEKGWWPECTDLPKLYALGKKGARQPERAAILDVGMNLGACTSHLLLTTDAQARAAARLSEPGASIAARRVKHAKAISAHFSRAEHAAR
eukprot:scaffold324559_cov67-Tisochrysis_lutea.AAC.1